MVGHGQESKPQGLFAHLQMDFTQLPSAMSFEYVFLIIFRMDWSFSFPKFYNSYSSNSFKLTLCSQLGTYVSMDRIFHFIGTTVQELYKALPLYYCVHHLQSSGNEERKEERSQRISKKWRENKKNSRIQISRALRDSRTSMT